MKIVIITQNQENFLLGMYNAVKSFKYVFVLDRCVDNSESICIENGITYIKNDKGDGFLAGYARQLGVNFFGSDDYILFLDGDKIPKGDLGKIYNYIDANIDCLLFKTIGDTRTFGSDILLKFPKENPHNTIYSCGVMLSPKLMKKCIEYSTCGRVWNEIFDGKWGEEDRFIGDVAIFHDMNIMCSSCVVLTTEITGIKDTNRLFELGQNTIKRLFLRKKIGYPF